MKKVIVTALVAIIVLIVGLFIIRIKNSVDEKFTAIDEAIADQARENNNVLQYFNWNKGATFTQVRDNNAIALHLQRNQHQKFTYRIEVTRQWRSSMLDTGTVVFEKIIGDSLVVLRNKNSQCLLNILISNDSLQNKLFTQIVRTCTDTTQNITAKDFPEIRLKSNF